MSVSSLENRSGEPAWRVALFFPEQGGWTEADYWALEGGPLVEYDRGYIEVLDVPTKQHQRMAQFLFTALQAYVSSGRYGEVFMAPLPVRLWAGKYREPDVVFVSDDRGETDGYPDGADLVMEVVSQGLESRRRDIEIKVDEYVRAGIPEYWIVDPEEQTVTVHELVSDHYEPTKYSADSIAVSRRLPGFGITVADIFTAAIGPS